MTTLEQISIVFPALKQGRDFTLNGELIATWTPRQSGLSQPSPSALAAAADKMAARLTRRELSPLTIAKRLTPEELATLSTSSNATVRSLLMLFTSATVVHSDNQDVAAAKTALVALGLLSQDRVNAVFDFSR